uniref:Uncharacterized protein n=1 Tax=Arundo donax TaxID=35708 RepID=A0A0A9F760_ARUDO
MLTANSKRIWRFLILYGILSSKREDNRE